MNLLLHSLEAHGDARSAIVTSSARRAGVTLIELLVVIAIIAVIAAVSIGALMVIPEHARTRGTEALVAKINTKLVQRLNEFESRRDSITPLASCDLPLAPSDTPSRARVIATVRTMRQVFPEWFELKSSLISDGYDNDWDGLTNEPDEIIAGDWNSVDWNGDGRPDQGDVITPNGVPDNPTRGQPDGPFYELPAAAIAHLQYIQRIFADNTLRPGGASFASMHQPETTRAECLYMIVTGDGLDTAEFAPNEIGDTDEDGLPEFVDKWGRPILFFLWPTNYTSPRQKPGSETNPDDPNQMLTEWNVGTGTGWWGETSPRNTLPLRQRFESLYFSLSDVAGNNPKAYRTYPLVISAGGDGGFGLQTPGPFVNATMGDFDDIGTIGTTNFKRAERITNAGQDGYGMDADNIDNHSLRVR